VLVARPDHAIAADALADSSDIYPSGNVLLGTMPLLLKTKGANESLHHTEKV
jgi:hypothetical protein